MNEGINIPITLQSGGAKSELRSFVANARAAFKDFNSDLKRTNAEMQKTSYNIDRMNKAFIKASSTKISGLFGNAGHGIDVARDQKAQSAYFDSIYGNINRVSNAAKKAQTPFAGWAMSVMFFGMAIQRTFTQIYQFGTKAFQEIQHSIEGTVTNTDMLEGSMKYLGYTIGEALEPVVAFLIPIIDMISEWISENPTLTATVITLGLAIGTLLFNVGMLVLAYNGLKDAAMLAFGTDIEQALTKNGGIIGLLKTGFSNLKTEVIATGAALKTMSLGSLLGLGAIIVGIILLVIWIFKLKDAMGGWGEFFKSVARGVLRVITLLAEGFVWLGDKIVSGVVWALNLVIDAINALLESELVQWGAKKLGIEVTKIEKIQGSQYEFGDAILRKYLDWEATGFLAPDNGYMEYGGITPKSGNTYYIDKMTIQSDNLDQMNQSVEQNTTG